MVLLLSALAFVVLLTGLILIHECGHFFAARAFKVEVEEFGFGLPPRARGLFTWKGTLFSLNWIPFGGFVRLKGEGAIDDSERKTKGSFGAASVFARMVVLVAGVAMNFLLALVLLLIGFSVGRWIPTYLSLDDMKAAAARGDIHLTLNVMIDGLTEDGTAKKAAVPTRSLLVAVDGAPVTDPAEVVQLQEGKRSVTYSLLVGETFTEERSVTVPVRDGKTGVVLRTVARDVSAGVRSFASALSLSVREIRVVTVQTVIGISKLIHSVLRSATVPEGITGIVGIAVMTYASVQEGFLVYLRLVALLSLSLAILNVLPFPALDGGRMLFVLWEAVARRPVPRRLELAVNTGGFVFLLLLILLVTFYDVVRIFS